MLTDGQKRVIRLAYQNLDQCAWDSTSDDDVGRIDLVMREMSVAFPGLFDGYDAAYPGSYDDDDEDGFDAVIAECDEDEDDEAVFDFGEYHEEDDEEEDDE